MPNAGRHSQDVDARSYDGAYPHAHKLEPAQGPLHLRSRLGLVLNHLVHCSRVEGRPLRSHIFYSNRCISDVVSHNKSLHRTVSRRPPCMKQNTDMWIKSCGLTLPGQSSLRLERRPAIRNSPGFAAAGLGCGISGARGSLSQKVTL